MRILDRYVARAVATGTSLALGALLAIFSVVNLLEELGDGGAGAYGWREALSFVALTLPAEALALAPAAALLGSLMALGRLGSANELVAMEAAGISRGRLVRAVLQAAALIAVAAGLNGELVAAPLARHAYRLRAAASSPAPKLETAGGLWIRDGSRVVNVRRPEAGGRVHDVHVYSVRDGQLQRYAFAPSAVFEDDGWRMESLVETDLGDAAPETRRVPAERWSRLVSPEDLRLLSVPLEQRSLADLAAAMARAPEGDAQRQDQRLAFVRRLAMPLETAVMVLLALPLVLTTLRGAKAGQRIVVGVLLGLTLQLVERIGGGLGRAYALDPVATTLAPMLLALAWAVRGIRRTSW
jgi:lipopolysaccharide export system permease protein